MMWLGLLFKIGLPLLLVGGGLWYVNDRAYNRGVTATVKKMEVLIQRGVERRDVDFDKLKKVPESELDDELRKLCEMHKKPGQVCK